MCVLVVFVPYGSCRRLVVVVQKISALEFVTLYHTYIHMPKLIYAHGHDVYIIENYFLSKTTDLVGAPAINNTYKYFKCEAIKKNENRKLCLRNKNFSFFGWNCCCCLTINEKYMQKYLLWYSLVLLLLLPPLYHSRYPFWIRFSSSKCSMLVNWQLFERLIFIFRFLFLRNGFTGSDVRWRPTFPN